jgi:hypothetical protein
VVVHHPSSEPVRTPSNRFFNPGGTTGLLPSSSRSWSSVRPPERPTANDSASATTSDSVDLRSGTTIAVGGRRVVTASGQIAYQLAGIVTAPGSIAVQPDGQARQCDSDSRTRIKRFRFGVSERFRETVYEPR